MKKLMLLLLFITTANISFAQMDTLSVYDGVKLEITKDGTRIYTKTSGNKELLNGVIYMDGGMYYYIARFKNGIIHGKYLNYVLGAKLVQKATYKNGKLHGSLKEYSYNSDEKRILNEISNWKNGEMQGKFIYFFCKNKIMLSGFIDGNMGEQTEYYENGNKKTSCTLNESRNWDIVERFDENGTKKPTYVAQQNHAKDTALQDTVETLRFSTPLILPTYPREEVGTIVNRAEINKKADHIRLLIQEKLNCYSKNNENVSQVKYQFIVHKNGTIEYIKIISSPSPKFATKVIKIIKKLHSTEPFKDIEGNCISTQINGSANYMLAN